MAPNPKCRWPTLTIVPITNSVNDSVHATFGSLVNSLFEVAKAAQLAVKQLKGENSYNGVVQQV